MKEALAGKPVEDFSIPEGVVVVPVDLSAAGTCAKPVTMAFLAGTEPKNTCGPSRSTAPKPEAAPAPTPEPSADVTAPQAVRPKGESP
jgi:membrane carboxypeptidase/penicillin-binding protein